MTLVGQVADAEALQPLADPEAGELAPVAILNYVAHTGQTAGAKELAITSSSDAFLHRTRPGAIFATPIHFEARIRGVLYLDSPSRSAFSATDRTIISSLASQAVLALDRTLAAVEAKEAETKFLQKMSHELR